MKKIYGIDFAGFWVTQSTRVIDDLGEGDAFYRPAHVYGDSIVPTEYVVASGPSRVLGLFWKFFDHFRKRNNPNKTLILACMPTIIEYEYEDVIGNPTLREAVSESCMAYYYGWSNETLPTELMNAISGKERYEELF